MSQCNCQICKVHRGIGRIEKKYKITKKDMAPIDELRNMAREDSDSLGMLLIRLREAKIDRTLYGFYWYDYFGKKK